MPAASGSVQSRARFSAKAPSPSRAWTTRVTAQNAGNSQPPPSFEKKNPITTLMTDVNTGTIREDVMNEKLMSAIVEIKVPVERTEEIIRLVWDIEKQVDTVVALGVGTRCDETGDDTVVSPILERLGYTLHRAKTNAGLGRITNALEQARPESIGVAR